MRKRRQERPPYKIHNQEIPSLITTVERRIDKKFKVRAEIMRILKEASANWQDAILSWNLIEAFVDDFCDDKENGHSENYRGNIRGLFENREKPSSYF